MCDDSSPKYVLRKDTRYGEVRTFDEADLVSRFLVEYGEWSYLEILFLSQFKGQFRIAYDIGAYLGTFSLSFAQELTPNKIVSVEANPKVWDAFEYNIEQNLSCPGVFYRGALGKENTEIKAFYVNDDPDNNGALTLLGDADCSHDGKVLNIPCRTLKNLRDEQGDYDFLKLDIEGMELQVLQTDQKWLIENKPVVWAECNQDKRALKLLDFFLWAGFDVYYYAYPAYNPGNYKNSKKVLFPFAYEAGLLAGQFSNFYPSLSEKLKVAGCVFKNITSTYELRQAMWHTPRWGKPEWLMLEKNELVALLSHEISGDKFMSFLIQGNDG